MPWYFYEKTGNLVMPKSPSTIATGCVVMSPMPFTGTPPDGYLFCDGASVLKSSYLDLFGVIGTMFGSADINHFNVPNFKARMPRGVISSAFIGDTGGSSTHSHALNNHTHTGGNINHTHSMSVAHGHYISHDHVLRAHTHGVTTFSIGYPFGGQERDAYYSPPHDVSAAFTHDHSIGGGTTYFLSGELNASVPYGSSLPTPDAQVDGAVESLDNRTTSSLSTSTDSPTSSTVANIPPYLVFSFLIKI